MIQNNFNFYNSQSRKIFEPVVIDYLNSLSIDDRLSLYNAIAVHLSDNPIYMMDELDDMLCGFTPTEILQKLDCDFSVSDEYFMWDGWGNIISFDNPDDYIDTQEMATNILWGDKIINVIDDLNYSELILLMKLFDASAGEEIRLGLKEG